MPAKSLERRLCRKNETPYGCRTRDDRSQGRGKCRPAAVTSRLRTYRKSSALGIILSISAPLIPVGNAPKSEDSAQRGRPSWGPGFRNRARNHLGRARGGSVDARKDGRLVGRVFGSGRRIGAGDADNDNRTAVRCNGRSRARVHYTVNQPLGRVAEGQWCGRLTEGSLGICRYMLAIFRSGMICFCSESGAIPLQLGGNLWNIGKLCVYLRTLCVLCSGYGQKMKITKPTFNF